MCIVWSYRHTNQEVLYAPKHCMTQGHKIPLQQIGANKSPRFNLTCSAVTMCCTVDAAPANNCCRPHALIMMAAYHQVPLRQATAPDHLDTVAQQCQCVWCNCRLVCRDLCDYKSYVQCSAAHRMEPSAEMRVAKHHRPQLWQETQNVVGILKPKAMTARRLKWFRTDTEDLDDSANHTSDAHRMEPSAGRRVARPHRRQLWQGTAPPPFDTVAQ